MRLEDFRFKLTDTRTGESKVCSVADIFGYDTWQPGVSCNGWTIVVPFSLRNVDGHYFYGNCVADGLEIEVLEPDGEKPLMCEKVEEPPWRRGFYRLVDDGRGVTDADPSHAAWYE